MDDDIPEETKAQLEADAIMFGTGFAEKTDDGEYKRIDPTEISISTDGETTLKRTHKSKKVEDLEYSGSMTVKLEGKHIDCPRCAVRNTLPKGHILSLLSDGPINCRVCGYPLL